MPTRHVVIPGECLSTIGHQYGFGDYRTIYDHPANADLKKLRPNPNIIHPGDVVVIPDKGGRSESAPTGAVSKFVVRRATRTLRIKVLVHGHDAVAHADYVLRLPGKPPLSGKTHGDGILEQTIPFDAPRGELNILGASVALTFGALNPMRKVSDNGVSGAQSRLHNLGFDAGPSDGIVGRRTHAALALFQAENKLRVTGKLDAATIAALEKQHGS